jgi:hypothetical protein
MTSVGESIRCVASKTQAPVKIQFAAADSNISPGISNAAVDIYVNEFGVINPIGIYATSVSSGIDAKVSNVFDVIEVLFAIRKPVDIDVTPATDMAYVNAFKPSDILVLQISDKTKRPKITCSEICSVGVSEAGYEVFMVKEGVFLLFDGYEFSVLKEHGKILSK